MSRVNRAMMIVTWADRMVSRMKEMGISRTEFCNDIGVSQSAFSLWKSHDRSPTNIDTYVRIAARLRVRVEWLLFGVVTELNDEESRIIQIIRYNPAALRAVQKTLEFWRSTQQHAATEFPIVQSRR